MDERQFGDPRPDPSEPVVKPYRFIWLGAALGAAFIVVVVLLFWLFSR